MDWKTFYLIGFLLSLTGFLLTLFYSKKTRGNRDDLLRSLKITEESAAKLETLKNTMGLATPAEVINTFMTMGEWIVKETEDGRWIRSVKEGTQFRELDMIPLEYVRRHSAKGLQ